MRPRLRSLAAAAGLLGVGLLDAAEPLPIDPLWKSETFRRSVTASFGIDSRIEPRLTEDEAFYLDESAKAMADEDREKAASVLRDSSLLEKSPAMLFNLATLEFEASRPEAAAERFEQALALFPNFRDAHRNYAIVLVQAGEFKKAKTHLVRALELGAQDGLATGLLGYCHAREGHHQPALDAYRLALLTQPDERQWRLGEAEALLALERPREAASILQGLLGDASADPAPWLLQADAWLTLGDELAAAANLEFLHRVGTLDAPAKVSLGHLYAQQGLPELALDRYLEALADDSPPAPARILEGLELFLSQSDWTRAADLAESIGEVEAYRSSLSPEEGERELVSRLVRARAILELETGDAEAGAALVADWLRREPLDGDALLLLARFHESSGRRAEAEMLLEQAARMPDHAAAAALAHGRLLVAAGEHEAALEHLEKSHELEPGDALASYLAAIRELVRPRR